MPKVDETKIHIFVNRRKFTDEQGVTPVMAGIQIAKLVDAPVDNVVVKRETGPDKQAEISLHESIEVKNGDHFLVTRKNVEGGYD